VLPTLVLAAMLLLLRATLPALFALVVVELDGAARILVGAVTLLLSALTALARLTILLVHPELLSSFLHAAAQRDHARRCIGEQGGYH
jgi:hypothetical protein